MWVAAPLFPGSHPQLVYPHVYCLLLSMTYASCCTLCGTLFSPQKTLPLPLLLFHSYPCHLLPPPRNPADMGGRMMTFTYVALLSGLVAWNLPGGADSIMSRVSVRCVWFMSLVLY